MNKKANESYAPTKNGPKSFVLQNKHIYRSVRATWGRCRAVMHDTAQQRFYGQYRITTLK